MGRFMIGNVRKIQGNEGINISPHDKAMAIDLRNFVFKSLYAYNDKQVCLPVHRDFKLHNILFNVNET